MPVRSMTGFAQVKGSIESRDGAPSASFTLSLKSVNHRFLDLHLRLPADTDALEVKLRRGLKEKLARGHVELTLSIENSNGQQAAINRPLVEGYIQAFRQAAREFGIVAEPDLNAVFRIPGALAGGTAIASDALDGPVLTALETAVGRLNEMRSEEGRGIERELRERLERLRAATAEIEKFRSAVLKANFERLQSRLRELLASQTDSDRLMQEAAIAADRSDIREEIARMNTHLDHFLGLLDSGGEVGKKLDFLLQEMNREANTLLSKTSGVVAEAMRITELGLQMKSEVEKLREQVQNLE
jgi:uncharacterized protein (TIGR00255 family)